MSKENLADAQYYLRKALTLYGPDLSLSHPWVSESDRWKELVFALLVQVSHCPEGDLRKLACHVTSFDH